MRRWLPGAVMLALKVEMRKSAPNRCATNCNAAGRRMSSRRLRRSIEAGRILTVDELQSDPADTGVLNHIPFVNRLVGWWGRMRAADWLKTASLEKRAALKRDLHPIIEIYEQL